MSDTPRTEAEVARLKGPTDDLITIDANFAAQLERELNAANDRIKRLEEAGDEMEQWTSEYKPIYNWHKAKEAKL